MQWLTELMGAIGPFLLAVALGVLSWAGAAVLQYFRARAKNIGSEAAARGLDLLADVADAVVCDLTASMVEKEKSVSRDGKLPVHIAREIKDTAIYKVQDILPRETLTALSRQNVSLHSAIGSAIERAVANRKTQEGK
ncbi:MAG: hypothetical protein SWH61_05385 [Thermodesulfobacteriota bacterium]|nr:hypothetical protein [Thermodesulfobacteriota bacterium]